MLRRLRVVIVGVAATAVLAACGSGDGGDGNAALPGGPGPTTAATGTAPAATGTPADTVLGSYLGFWDAVIAANKASDPASPRLATVAADPELSRVRDVVSRNKIQKLSLRGQVAHKPTPPKVSGSTATVEDCYDISGWNPVDLTTGKPVEATDVSGTGRYRARYTLRRSGSGWLVVDQKALGGC